MALPAQIECCERERRLTDSIAGVLDQGELCQAIYSLILTASALRWKKTRLAAAPLTVIIIVGGELLGKFIILSFRDDEESLFSKVISSLSSVADFSTVAASTDAPLLFGSLQIDPQRRLVWQSGQAVELTPMEFDILLLLARRPGQVFTARQIYEAVAENSYDASWTGISSMVYKLRRKLGAGIIETVRGNGYKFVIPGTSPK